MSYQAEQYIAQGVIQHLDGNMELFQKYIKQAMEIFDRDKHLYVTIGELVGRETA